jgi:hypothetical protein
MPSSKIDPARQWRLPPLILHPFSDPSAPDRLAESSRATLMLQGLLPNDDFTVEELNKRILDGRFYEVRMLFYVGKDLNRWIDQCMELVPRDEELRDAGIRRESFAAMLIEDPPENMRRKLEVWGVVDHKAIFRRALGLNVIFASLPAQGSLTDEFIRYHHRYADQLFQYQQQSTQFTDIKSANFQFELYASGEYARLLEREWEER